MIREFKVTISTDGVTDEYTNEYSVGEYGAKEPTLMRDLMKDVIQDANEEDQGVVINSFYVQRCYDMELVYYEYVLHFTIGYETRCATYRGTDVGLITFDQRTAKYKYINTIK